MKLLLLLFILIPAVELSLLILSGEVIGILWTFILIVITGIIGARLAKKEGTAALQRIREDLAMGRIPGQSLLEGLCILIGGIFLITPGFLTDLTGFLLMVPFFRRKGADLLREWVREQVKKGNFVFFYKK